LKFFRQGLTKKNSGKKKMVPKNVHQKSDAGPCPWEFPADFNEGFEQVPEKQRDRL
jgi:hypothetical protein